MEVSPSMLLICGLIYTLFGTNTADTSKCPYAVLPMTSLKYRLNEILSMKIVSANHPGPGPLGSWSITIVDSSGRSQGQFVSGTKSIVTDNGNRLIDRGRGKTRVLTLSWRAPSQNAGTLFIKYTVGPSSSSVSSCQFPLVFDSSVTAAAVQPGPSMPTKKIFKNRRKRLSRPTNGTTWCMPGRKGPRYEVIPGTKCQKYLTKKNRNKVLGTSECPAGLIFSTKLCTCSQEHSTTCYRP